MLLHNNKTINKKVTENQFYPNIPTGIKWILNAKSLIKKCTDVISKISLNNLTTELIDSRE